MKRDKVNRTLNVEDFFKEAVQVIEELVKLANVTIGPEEFQKLVKQIVSYIVSSVWNRARLQAKWIDAVTNAKQSLSGVKKPPKGKKKSALKVARHPDGTKACKPSVGKKK